MFNIEISLAYEHYNVYSLVILTENSSYIGNNRFTCSVVRFVSPFEQIQIPESLLAPVIISFDMTVCCGTLLLTILSCVFVLINI